MEAKARLIMAADAKSYDAVTIAGRPIASAHRLPEGGFRVVRPLPAGVEESHYADSFDALSALISEWVDNDLNRFVA